MDDLTRMIRKVDLPAKLAGRPQCRLAQLVRSKGIVKAADNDGEDEVEVVLDTASKDVERLENMQERIPPSFREVFGCEVAVKGAQDLLEETGEVRLELAFDRFGDGLDEVDDGDLKVGVGVPKVVDQAKDVFEVVANVLLDDGD